MPHSIPHQRPAAPFLDRLETALRPVAAWGTFRRGARHASVNAILFHRGGEWRIPFVIRRSDLRSHPGQVGLPGGQIEPDEDGLGAALRETEEELRLSRTALRPLGAAPPVYTAATNFMVATFVTYLSAPPTTFDWDARELVGVVSVPVRELLDRDAWRGPAAAIAADGPFFGRQLATQGVVIWGLTARIMGGLLPLIRAACDRGRWCTSGS